MSIVWRNLPHNPLFFYFEGYYELHRAVTACIGPTGSLGPNVRRRKSYGGKMLRKSAVL
jgi:hypothetical protein